MLKGARNASEGEGMLIKVLSVQVALWENECQAEADSAGLCVGECGV